jgi:hypothetical protein
MTFVFQDVVEGLLDAVPIDRQYIFKLFKLNKRSLAEASWIYEKVWTKNQRDDIHNFLYKTYIHDDSDILYDEETHYIANEWLLCLAASFNKVNDRYYDNFVLRTASKYGKLEVLLWLVESYRLSIKDVRSRDNEALREAAYGGHLETVRYLVETFNLTVEDVRSRDNGALRLAASDGHLEVVRYLVETFKLTVEDARTQDNDGLRRAAYGGHLEIVRYLVETFNLTS